MRASQELSPELATALGQNKVSDRAAKMVIGETTHSLGQSI